MKKLLWILFSLGLILFIVFGALTFVEVQKISENTHEKTVLNKTYQDKIKHINVNAVDAAVTIKKGKDFNVKAIKSNADFKVKSEVRKDTLNIGVKMQDPIINLNVFNNKYNKIVITVPQEMDSTFVMTDTGEINVKDLKSKKTTFHVDTGSIDLTDSKLGKLEINADTGNILTSHTQFTNGNIEADTSSVKLNDAPADIPLNIKTDTGSIKIKYNHSPKNTLLDIQQDTGKAQININALKNKRVGSGDNLVKIESDVGSVQID